MPALFAYLIAVCLLLGGGYGALNWLAAPDPVKVAAKAKPKPKSPPSYEARAEQIPEAISPASSSEVSSAVAESSAAPTTPDPVAQPATMAPTPDRQTRSVNAQASIDEARRKVEQPVRQTASAGSPSNLRTTASAPDTIARVQKRAPSRQASNRSEKRALVMMTLRTIEYPDGRRATRLIPYGGGERALAYQSDD
jgi:hypothetical protein